MSDYTADHDASSKKREGNLKSEASETTLVDTNEQQNLYVERRASNISHPFGKRSSIGAGMFFKFTHYDNRLIRWIFEKHSFKESYMDYPGMSPADF